MSNPTSVYDKARALTAEAARLRQGESAEHEASRVTERVNEIMPLLQRISLLARAGCRLHAIGGKDSVSLSGLDEGRSALARHAGLPSNQAFSAAKSRLNVVVTRLSADLTTAWSRWVELQMAALPLLRMSLLDPADQERARQWQDELAGLAKKAIPTSTDISMFQSAASQLAEALGRVSDPPEQVLVLAAALKIDPRAIRAARDLAARKAAGEIGWAPQLRELIGYQRTAAILGDDAAAANLAGIAPEEDQDVVADAIHRAFGRRAAPLALGRQV